MPLIRFPAIKAALRLRLRLLSTFVRGAPSCLLSSAPLPGASSRWGAPLPAARRSWTPSSSPSRNLKIENRKPKLKILKIITHKSKFEIRNPKLKLGAPPSLTGLGCLRLWAWLSPREFPSSSSSSISIASHARGLSIFHRLRATDSESDSVFARHEEDASEFGRRALH